jgi:hypothetical protein
VASGSRERATIDLRGLGPALRAHASARNLTVSDVARLALADVLKISAPEIAAQVGVESQAGKEAAVKLTIRLRHSVAARLTALARACGLSHGAYLTTLLDEVPAPPLAVAQSLGRSTEQLAAVSADLNELTRVIRRDGVSTTCLIEDWLRPLVRDVRQHVELASRLMSELRPARSGSGGRRGKPFERHEASP